MYCIVLSLIYLCLIKNKTLFIYKNNTMKSLQIIIVTLLTALFTTSAFAVLMVPAPISIFALTDPKGSGNVVKVTKHNGVYIPVVDLSVIEILSTRTTTPYHGTILREGKYIVLANLPVVEITANRNGNTRLPAFIRNGEKIAIIELPLIEIRAELPYGLLTAAIQTKSQTLAVVNLPEIVISSYTSEYKILSVNISEEIIMPIVNLPAVEIVPQMNWLSTSASTAFSFESNEIEWIYISLKNCGITLQNKIICEVAGKINKSIVILENEQNIFN